MRWCARPRRLRRRSNCSLTPDRARARSFNNILMCSEAVYVCIMYKVKTAAAQRAVIIIINYDKA